MKIPPRVKGIHFLFSFCTVFLICTFPLDLLKANQLGVAASQALIMKNSNLANTASLLSEYQSCRLQWFLGLVEDKLDRKAQRDSAWTRTIVCFPISITFIHKYYPDEEGFAELAIQAHPEIGESWFWLADFKPDRRIEYFRKGLELSPNDGRRWIILGDLLKETEPEAAIEAYLQSCIHGDPGSNGCYRAGMMAQAIGDISSAIKYYRLSQWEGAQKRADELER